MIRRPPRSTRTDTLFPTRRSSDLLANASTVQVWRGPMRAILAGAVESSRVALGAIARTPGWTLPLVISLPRDLDGRHSDFADLSGPARSAGERSEERRVGKECVSPCRSRGSAYH